MISERHTFNEFVRLYSESENFEKHFGFVLFRHVVDADLGIDIDDESQAQVFSALEKVDGFVLEVDLELKRQDKTVTISHGMGEDAGVSEAVYSLIFMDWVTSPEQVQREIEAQPHRPVIIADDSKIGWRMAEKVAKKNNAVLMWWLVLKDGYYEWSNMSEIGDINADMYERGRRIGYKQGFSEGYFYRTDLEE